MTANTTKPDSEKSFGELFSEHHWERVETGAKVGATVGAVYGGTVGMFKWIDFRGPGGWSDWSKSQQPLLYAFKGGVNKTAALSLKGGLLATASTGLWVALTDDLKDPKSYGIDIDKNGMPSFRKDFTVAQAGTMVSAGLWTTWTAIQLAPIAVYGTVGAGLGAVGGEIVNLGDAVRKSVYHHGLTGDQKAVADRVQNNVTYAANVVDKKLEAAVAQANVGLTALAKVTHAEEVYAQAGKDLSTLATQASAGLASLAKTTGADKVLAQMDADLTAFGNIKIADIPGNISSGLGSMFAANKEPAAKVRHA